MDSKFSTLYYRFGVEYHLVDSCNLRCAGCSHYSSLLKEITFPSKDEILEDLSLLKDKTQGRLKWLRLLGGEPLLHPDINDLLTEIRKMFPDVNIILVTNGLLLKKLGQPFYGICVNNKIDVCLTDYRVINITEIFSECAKYGLKLRLYRTNFTWYYQSLRLVGEENNECYKRCKLRIRCINYKKGNIYLCPHIAYIDIFNKYFKTNIPLTETDYIPLKDVKDFDDLIDKIESAHPNFCYNFCNCYDAEHPKMGKWKRTEENIEEFCLMP